MGAHEATALTEQTEKTMSEFKTIEAYRGEMEGMNSGGVWYSECADHASDFGEVAEYECTYRTGSAVVISEESHPEIYDICGVEEETRAMFELAEEEGADFVIAKGWESGATCYIDVAEAFEPVEPAEDAGGDAGGDEPGYEVDTSKDWYENDAVPSNDWGDRPW